MGAPGLGIWSKGVVVWVLYIGSGLRLMDSGIVFFDIDCGLGFEGIGVGLVISGCGS